MPRKATLTPEEFIRRDEARHKRLALDLIADWPGAKSRERLGPAYDAGMRRAASRLRDFLQDIADVQNSGPNPHLRAMIADAIAEADRLAGEA